MGEPKLRKTVDRTICLTGLVVLAFFLSSAAGAATLDDADRLLQGPDLNKEKAIKALAIYESLLPPAGAQRLPVLERLARTGFILGDIAESGQRRLYYEQGRQFAEKILQESPQNVAGHYWLGLNLGGLADVNRLQGRRLLPQILEELGARRLDKSRLRPRGGLSRPGPHLLFRSGSSHFRRRYQ